jgi:hypothetical protein
MYYKIPQIPMSDKTAFTIGEFCSRVNISRPLFYKMKNQGKGPRLAYAGAKTLITLEAERDWLRGLEAAAAAAAEAPKAA